MALSPEQVFSCPEESLFYSQCLQKALGGSMGLLGAAGDAARWAWWSLINRVQHGLCVGGCLHGFPARTVLLWNGW